MAKGWLITGSEKVWGDIAAVALEAGDRVVAGARRTKELAPLVAQYGEHDLYHGSFLGHGHEPASGEITGSRKEAFPYRQR